MRMILRVGAFAAVLTLLWELLSPELLRTLGGQAVVPLGLVLGWAMLRHLGRGLFSLGVAFALLLIGSAAWQHVPWGALERPGRAGDLPSTGPVAPEDATIPVADALGR